MSPPISGGKDEPNIVFNAEMVTDITTQNIKTHIMTTQETKTRTVSDLTE